MVYTVYDILSMAEQNRYLEDKTTILQNRLIRISNTGKQLKCQEGKYVPDAKTKKVMVYLTEKEFNLYKEVAESMDMTVPKFIRHCTRIYMSALKRSKTSVDQ